MNWITLLSFCLSWSIGISNPQDGEFRRTSYHEYTGHLEQFNNVNLELIVESRAVEHYVGEPLKLSIKVRNSGSEPVSIPLSMVSHGNMVVRVFDASHQNVLFPRSDILRVYRLQNIRSIELMPTEFWGTEKLTDDYKIALSEPGIYYVQVKGLIEAPPKMRDRVWIGGLRSAPLEIKVLPTRIPQK